MTDPALSDTYDAFSEVVDALEEIAARHGITPEILIKSMEERLSVRKDGPGRNLDRPERAHIEYPDGENRQRAFLVIHVRRSGNRLIGGRRKLRIPLDYSDGTVQKSVDALFDSAADDTVTLRLGETSLRICGLLKLDVYTTLMSYISQVQAVGLEKNTSDIWGATKATGT